METLFAVFGFPMIAILSMGVALLLTRLCLWGLLLGVERRRG